jgi:hypothetical protein
MVWGTGVRRSPLVRPSSIPVGRAAGGASPSGPFSFLRKGGRHFAAVWCTVAPDRRIYDRGVHMRRTLFAFATAVAVAVTLLAATATANNGIGPVPPAVDSQAFFEGGADTSDGITPEQGLILAGFQKGSESYNGSDTTTVVDFTLPEGVTIHNDPVECSGFPNNDCLIILDSTCSDPTGVTVNGNEIEFQIACDPGEDFIWLAEVDSLLPDGNYDVNVQFKVGTTKRVKDGPNMWQIKMPGVFQVPFVD